jgi:hypothetical protein
LGCFDVIIGVDFLRAYSVGLRGHDLGVLAGGSTRPLEGRRWYGRDSPAAAPRGRRRRHLATPVGATPTAAWRRLRGTQGPSSGSSLRPPHPPPTGHGAGSCAAIPLPSAAEERAGAAM